MAKKRLTGKQMRERCADAVPTNWLDPLLTGPGAVLKEGVYTYDGADIESLFLKLRERILAVPLVVEPAES